MARVLTRLAGAVAGAALALAACGRAEPRVVAPAASPPPPVRAVAAGVTLSGSQVSAGALLRNDGTRAAFEIGLDLAFLDRDGRRVAETTDSLRYCPAGATCPWGGTFVGSQFGPSWRRIARVEVGVRVGYLADRSPAPIPFPVRREDGVATGDVPGPEGDAYVVGFAGDRPVSGVALVLRRGEPRSRRLADQALLPVVPGERLEGTFYPGPVSSGS
jgi:hypothetical protein